MHVGAGEGGRRGAGTGRLGRRAAKPLRLGRLALPDTIFTGEAPRVRPLETASALPSEMPRPSAVLSKFDWSTWARSWRSR